MRLAKPSWYLASAPLPVSYWASCYMVHLPTVGFRRDVSHVLSKLPVRAAFSATWTMLSGPFLLPKGATRYPRLASLHAHCFHSLRLPAHSTLRSEAALLHQLSLWRSLPPRSQSTLHLQRAADHLLR